MDDAPRIESTEFDPLQTPRLGSSADRVTSSGPPTPEEMVQARGDPANLMGSYLLVRLAGQGGMGEVYRAWQDDLQRWVALKLLRPGIDAERFRLEARAAAALDHPGIARVYESGEAAGRPYIALQWIDGVPLHRAELCPRRAVQALRSVCEAVQHAHERGVIHRDIKPSNVMIRADGAAVLVDFGLARITAASHLTATGVAVGTPGFMAPEQAWAAGPAVGPTADVFAIGATLYYALAGRAPIEGDDAVGVLVRLLSEERIPPPSRWNPEVDRDLDTVVSRCLEREPERRYPTAADLAADLGRWLDGQAVTARPVAPWEHAWRRVRRQPRLAAAAATLLVLLALGALGTIRAFRRMAREAEAREWRERAAHEFALGRTEQAAAAADRLTVLAPGSAAGHYWRGRAGMDRYQRGRFLPPAFRNLGLLELAPAFPDLPADRELAVEARRCFDRACAAADAGPEQADVARGLIALFDHRPGEAAPRLDRAWQAGVREPDLGLLRVEAHYGTRDFRAALQALDDLAQAWPKGPQQLLWEARVRHALAVEAELAGEEPAPHVRDALRCADAAIVAGAPEVHARVLRAQALVLRARFERGTGVDPEPAYREALETLAPVLDSGRPEALLAQGETLLARAESRQAEGKIDPDHPTDYEEAVAVIGRSIEAWPAYAGGPLRRAEAGDAFYRFLSLFGRGRPALLRQALDDCGRALELDPGLVVAEALSLRLRRLLALSAMPRVRPVAEIREEEIRGLEQLAPRCPVPVRSHYGAGVALFDWAEEEHLEGAEAGLLLRRSAAELDRALALHPGYVEALLQRGNVFQALTRAEAAQGLDPTEWHQRALQDFDRVVASRPQLADALHRRGCARVLFGNYLKRGGRDPSEEYGAAIADLDQAERLNPRHALTRSWRAMARGQWGHFLRSRGGDPRELYFRALVDYSAALEHLRYDTGTWFGRGTCRTNLGIDRAARGEDPREDYVGAVADFTAVMCLSPADWRGHSSRAEARALLGAQSGRRGEDPLPEYAAAMADLDEAIRRHPGDAGLHLSRAGVARRSAQARQERGLDGRAELDHAFADLDRAIELDPRCASAYLARGNLRVSLGHDDVARADFAQVRALDPRLAGRIPPGW